MALAERWSLVEYGPPTDLLGPIAQELGLTRSQIRELLLESGARTAKILGFSANPLAITGDGIRAIGFSGLVRVAPAIELEIAPKFLGLDPVHPRWREDFFFLATLSRHGTLLNSERLRSRSGERGDLHTLVARSVADMYLNNHRRPLRTYRTRRFAEFAFDGDIDPEAILQPEPDGFNQSAMVYDRINSFNATILAAVRELLPNLRDRSAIAQLERIEQALAPQLRIASAVRHRRLPSRARRWQPLHDLAVDILNGFGLSFSSGSRRAPGYVLDTWRVWEDFLGIALRVGFGSNRVRTQSSVKLGSRQRVDRAGNKRSAVATVTPDMMILDKHGSIPSFVVDAKYKGRLEEGRTRIDEADLYEALAFSKATACNTVVLAYPALPDIARVLGQTELFERINVDSVCVLGVEIETRGISSVAGLSRFANRCVVDLQSIVATQP